MQENFEWSDFNGWNFWVSIEDYFSPEEKQVAGSKINIVKGLNVGAKKIVSHTTTAGKL
jgi:hypothetical protein